MHVIERAIGSIYQAIFCTVPQVKQYSIPIPQPETLDKRALGLVLHHMEGMSYWWLFDRELIVAFEKHHAAKGVTACRSLVSGSSPSITP